MWSNGIKIAFYYKKPPNGWGLRPRTPKAFGGLELRPRPPSVICLSFIGYSARFPSQKFALFNKQKFAISLPLPLAKILVNCQQQATALDLPFYDMFTPQTFLVWKFLKTSLHVVCGLGPLQSKTLATPMVTTVTYHRLQSHLTS